MQIYPIGRRVLSPLWKPVSTPTTCGYLCRIFRSVLLSLTLFLLGVCSLSPPLFFVRLLSCVAFASASAFNADISQWQTGVVTDMHSSEYTNPAVVTFVECSQVCFLPLTLFLLAVCSLSPPLFFRAVAFLCSVCRCKGFQCGSIQVECRCCY